MTPSPITEGAVKARAPASLRLVSTQNAEAVVRSMLEASVAALPKAHTAFDLVGITKEQRDALAALDAAMNPLRRTLGGNATMPDRLALVPDQCCAVVAAALALMGTIGVAK